MRARPVALPRVAAVLLAAAALAGAPAPRAAAQTGDLHWRELAVAARLDADGRLHVSERQAMVFTGDWNGGERIFNVYVGQDLELRRVARVTAAGAVVELEEGSLDEVDEYDWVDNQTLRWRSRLPGDPPFEDTELTYVLDYTLSGVLQPTDHEGQWLLDHDFAFSDRQGVIERFTLDLELDPVWEPPPAFVGRHEATDLPPGRGWVGTWQLGYAAAGTPAAAPRAAPFAYRAVAAGAAAAAILWFLGGLFRREWRIGRLRRPDDLPDPPDRQWLEEHLLSLPAEQVGALWDRHVGTAEVAALLARLVAEGKLESEVVPKRGLFGREELRLRLPAGHDGFERSYERALVARLFFGGRVETDTAAVRKHYRSKGFDPAALIKSGVESAVGKSVRSRAKAPRKRRTLLLFAACAGAFLLEGLVHRPASAVVFALAIAIGALPIFGIASAAALGWRDRVAGALPWALPWLFFGLGPAASAAGLVFLDEVFGPGTLGVHPGLFGVLGILLVPVATFSSLTNVAATRESSEAIRRRQELVHARRHLARELRRERPDLADAWLPHLIALGLGGRVARWGKRFRVTAAGAGGAISSLGGSSGSFGGGGRGWSGGGGTFGGAGASGSWAAAVAGMAAGVASPSSGGSGGGGGGGGGGSSGGGGGGGW